MCQPRGRLTKKAWAGLDRSPHPTPPSLIVKKSCSCPHCCMRGGRKNRHEILHSSTAKKTDDPSGHQTQPSHQMCPLQRSTALSGCSLEATSLLLGNPSVASAEHLILRTFTPDMPLRITEESRHS